MRFLLDFCIYILYIISDDRDKQKEKVMKTKEIKWTTESGKEVKVTVSLITEKTLDADGDKITVPACEIEVKTEIKEIDFFSFLPPRKKSNVPSGYVAAIMEASSTRAIPLTQSEYDNINNAISEMESEPEWIAKQKKIEQDHKDIEDLEKTHRANGYCEKCGSYCYGDCEA